MNCARTIRYRLFSWLVIIAMIMMSFGLAGQTSVRAIDDAVVNITTGVGYGDDLRAALTAANDDDVIHVYEGTYEGISINTPVSLIAPNGPASVTITNAPAPGLTDHAIFVDAADVLLRGLTIASDEFGVLVTSIVDSSLTIEDCVFNDRSAMAVRFGNWGMSNEFDNARIAFTGNTVIGGTEGLFFLAEITNSSIVVSDNVFNGHSYTSHVYFSDDVYDSSIIIENNTFETFDDSVSGGSNQDFGLSRTSVEIVGNTFNDGNIAIELYRLMDDSDVLIKDNDIENCDIGISLYYIGDNSDIGVFAPSSVIIRDNTLDNIGQYGISIDHYIHGSVSIIDNIISNCGYYGIYLELNPQNWSQNQTPLANQIDLDIVGNHFTNCDESGIYFSNLDTTSSNDIDILIRKNSFFANNTGLDFDYVLLQANPEHVITITLNDFIENDTGIHFGSIRFADFSPDHLRVLLNQFSGNVQHAAYYQPRSEAIEEILATQNWWGDESGPVVMPNQIAMLSTTANGNSTPSGDPVSDNVGFDPWLARLVITPTHSSMMVGQTQVLTAQIVDNDGEPVIADGLTVLFRTSGTHSSEMLVPFSGLSAIRSYTGQAVGTDTIHAEVIFAGAASGLEAEIQVTWITQSASPTPTQPMPSPTQPAPTPTDPAPTPTEPAPAPTQPAGTDVSGGDHEIPQTGERGNGMLYAGISLILIASLLVILRKKQRMYCSEHVKH